MIELAQNSDVLVHECTMENELETKAIAYGHSTPSKINLNELNANSQILTVQKELRPKLQIGPKPKRSF